MLRNLTIEKASLDMNLLLKTIVIIGENKGSVTRDEFVKEMADYCGFPAVKKGKENRTGYNKSKFARYFGFVEVLNSRDLVLTERGKAAHGMIKREIHNGKECYKIKKGCALGFQELIEISILYDSFGRYNSGAEQSCTDLEPPRVILKTIDDLKNATKEEIGLVLWGIQNKLYSSLEDALEHIKLFKGNLEGVKREIHSFLGTKEINAINDFKLLQIFTDENICIVEKSEEGRSVYYKINKSINPEFLDDLRRSSPYYSADSQIYKIQNKQCFGIGGRVARIGDERYVLRVELPTAGSPEIFQREKLIPWLIRAINDEKHMYYLDLLAKSGRQIENYFGRFSKLDSRKNSVSSDSHAWSIDSLENYEVYNKIKKGMRAFLEEGRVRFPPNFLVIGEIFE